ncbi:MAG: SAM-dependent methyltransferase [Robiginitomaculum sp.]|nr:MAG: SAM-dependent methyltransferase [Robiginitomaculum sp.]
MIEASAIAHGEAVIDVGGGASVLVDTLLELGFQNLSVLDISRAALQSAKARLGSRANDVKWLCEDATRWTPAHPFRLWHDRAVFHFLTDAEDRQKYRTIAKANLVPGGHMIMATFAMDGPEKCSGLPVRRYSAQSMAAELGDGFALIEDSIEEHLTPGGRVQKFQYCRFLRV